MKQTTKRFLSMILGILFLLSSLLMYFELIKPAYSEAQQIKAQKNSLQIFLDSEKSVVERVQKLINSYEEQGKIQRAVSEVLPTKKDIAGAIVQLYGLAQNNGLSVKSFGVSVVQTPQKKSKAADYENQQLSGFETSLQKGVGTLSFDIQLGGSYEDLKNFLSALETNIRIFDVEQIGVQPVSATSGTGKPGSTSTQSNLFSYSISVKTYYQNQ